MNKQIRVLDIDGSLTCQRQLAEILGERLRIVAQRTLGPRLRYMCGAAARRSFAGQLDPALRDCLTFYGSGDFHHLSVGLVGQWSTPICVVVLDQHPDWDVTSPWPCCGSWINELLAMPQVRRVVVLGLGATDLRAWHLLRGNFGAVRAGRLELYPVSWARSLLPPTGQARLRCGEVVAQGLQAAMRWRTLAHEGARAMAREVFARLPTEEVYLSVDKDCLRSEFAVTNWEAGELDLGDLLGIVAELKASRTLVGADITGEWSQGPIANGIFRAIARADHPPQRRPSPQQLRRNEETNVALAQALAG